MYHVTFPPQSNRASWVFIGLVTDLDNNPIDISACSMVFAVRREAHRLDHHSDAEFLTFGGGGELIASTGNGKLTVVGLGTFRWFFTLQDMRGLCVGTHQTGLTLTNDDGTQTVQLAVGPLAIVEGVVP